MQGLKYVARYPEQLYIATDLWNNVDYGVCSFCELGNSE